MQINAYSDHIDDIIANATDHYVLFRRIYEFVRNLAYASLVLVILYYVCFVLVRYEHKQVNDTESLQRLVFNLPQEIITQGGTMDESRI